MDPGFGGGFCFGSELRARPVAEVDEFGLAGGAGLGHLATRKEEPGRIGSRERADPKRERGEAEAGYRQGTQGPPGTVRRLLEGRAAAVQAAIDGSVGMAVRQI